MLEACTVNDHFVNKDAYFLSEQEHNEFLITACPKLIPIATH